MKVLVVDDDALSLRVLMALVERLGHEPVAAADGLIAWERFRAEHCRVVISDWIMPGLDGIELLTRVRAMGGAEYTYFIFLTSRADPADIAEGMAAGADDLLSKPVAKEDLAARLRVASRIVSLQQEVSSRNRELSLANERMRQDLQAAAQIQAGLLPTSLPDLPDLAFAWLYRPCEQLGGDTLNLFRLDEHHVGFYVLDVSGHGVTSALLAVQVSRVLSPLITAGALLKRALSSPPGYLLSEPLQVIRELNELFPMDDALMQYFTIVYGIYHLPSHSLRCASAGHPGPLLVRHGGGVEIPEVCGNPIGFFSNAEAQFSEYQLSLAKGDRLYFISDGVIETLDARLESFGMEQLGMVLERNRACTLDDSLKAAGDELDRWRAGAAPTDDVTLIGFDRR